MTVPVLTAVGDARWEADLSAGLSRDAHGVQVVRRCVDLADLLAAAAAGLARAVILSADLRRLDREALSRLAFARVAVVGLVGAGDEGEDRRLRQLGVRHVLPHDASSQAVSTAVLAAVGELAGSPENDSSPAPPAPAEDVVSSPVATGKVVAVWGPVGAPGRTTIAVNLAAEIAALGVPVLLIDADTYGGVVGQVLGVLDEAPGLAAACRLANNGVLDAEALRGVALELRPTLHALTGITKADRWLEIRASAFANVLEVARSAAAFIVIDCGFCLEQDEELAYDTVAPRRNAATLVGLDAADVVVNVAGADPVGLARYLRTAADCAALTTGRCVTVANRVRRGVVGPGDPRREIAAALERYAGITDVLMVPDDSAAIDAALASGRTLGEAAPVSPARVAIRSLASQVAGVPEPTRRRRR